MKIGSRVRLSPHALRENIHPILRKKYGIVRGVVINIRGSCADVRYDHGAVHGTALIFLVEDEPFPYRSHRTMAEVIADEQKPIPA